MNETPAPHENFASDFPLISETRIDAPHVIGDASAEIPVRAPARQGKRSGRVAHQEETGPEIRPETDVSEIVEDETAAESNRPEADQVDLPCENEAAEIDDRLGERLEKQAYQLGRRLQEQRRDLDHREARLNTRSAMFDQEMRSARLWLNERRVELDEQEKSLDSQARALGEVQREASEFETKNAWHGRCKDLATSLEKRLETLHQAELQLEQSREENRCIQEALLDDQRKFNLWRRRQRERFQQDRRRAEAELDQRREALCRQSEEVDRSRLAMEQLRDELGRMHRSTLEIRLATEQLWIELSGSAPPASLTRSLGQIRSQLADQYREANAALLRQKEELAALCSQLAGQHQNLSAYRERIEQWAAGREEQIEQQLGRMVERESRLNRQESEFHQASQQWQDERLELKQEIRRLESILEEQKIERLNRAPLDETPILKMPFLKAS